MVTYKVSAFYYTWGTAFYPLPLAFLTSQAPTLVADSFNSHMSSPPEILGWFPESLFPLPISQATLTLTCFFKQGR